MTSNIVTCATRRARLLFKACGIRSEELDSEREELLGDDYFGTATMVYSDQQGFTDSDLEHVSHLRDIKQLYLPGTSVTNQGLGNLTELHRLEELGLENTRITDAGLAKLGTLKCLRRLILTGTRVTDSDVRELKEALPNIRVER